MLNLSPKKHIKTDANKKHSFQAKVFIIYILFIITYGNTIDFYKDYWKIKVAKQPYSYNFIIIMPIVQTDFCKSGTYVLFSAS